MTGTDKASQLLLLFQIILELEKQRIEVLCNILNRHNLHVSSFGQTLKHVRRPRLHPAQRWPLLLQRGHRSLHHSSFCHFQGQRRIEQAVQKVDMDKDIKALQEENSITAEDNKAEFLVADYFVSLIVLLQFLN